MVAGCVSARVGVYVWGLAWVRVCVCVRARVCVCVGACVLVLLTAPLVLPGPKGHEGASDPSMVKPTHLQVASAAWVLSTEDKGAHRGSCCC